MFIGIKSEGECYKKGEYKEGYDDDKGDEECLYDNK